MRLTVSLRESSSCLIARGAARTSSLCAVTLHKCQPKALEAYSLGLRVWEMVGCAASRALALHSAFALRHQLDALNAESGAAQACTQSLNAIASNCSRPAQDLPGSVRQDQHMRSAGDHMCRAVHCQPGLKAGRAAACKSTPRPWLCREQSIAFMHSLGLNDCPA